MAFRVCARLDVKSSFLVKGIQYEGLRKLGDIWDFANSYAQEGADEIVLVDAVATLFERKSLYELIHGISTRLRVPLTVIGGIKTAEDARRLFEKGADKVGINSAALQRPELLEEIASIYGSQAVVASVEAKRGPFGYECFFRNGRERSQISVESWVRRLNTLGCGELHVASVDMDGTMKGPDTVLLELVRANTDLPLIFGSGIRGAQDVLNLAKTGADAVSIASALHYKKIEIATIKNYLKSNSIPVRMI